MTPKKIYFIMIGLNTLLGLLILGSVFVGNNLIKKQSEKLLNIKTQNKVVEEQQTSLSQAKKDIDKYSDLNEIARSIVPQDKDQARTVREISKFADESGITLKDIAFQSSSLGEIIQKSSGGSTQSPTATAVPNALTQVKPVEGIKGVYALEIVVSSVEDNPIPYADFVKFLEKLESNRRTAHVDKIVVKPDDKDPGVSFVLTLNAYVKP